MVLRNGLIQIIGAEIRPQHIHKHILRVGRLPQQKIAGTHLAGGTDNELRVRHLLGVQIGRQQFFRQVLRLVDAIGHILGKGRRGFYKLMKGMGADTVYDHADYRLMSKRALEGLSEFKEVNIFLRGMVPLVGFKSTSVFYDRTPRLAGKSHYPFRKMLSLAFDGITSLSTKPIKLVTLIGFLVTLASFGGIVWSLVAYFTGSVVSGWASTVAIICFLGGIQLLSIGIIGSYIGKIYLETKGRPRYIISEETEEKK